MAGILANSASATMLSGDTAADKAVSGYITNERITLSVSPTGTDYVWGQAIPAGSAIARSGLTADDTATTTFIPDAAGEYVVTCTVDSTTTYVIRISVTRTAVSTSSEALRLQVKTNASITTPATGAAVYYSSDLSALASKDSAGIVTRIGRSLRGSVTWDPASTLDGAVTSTTVAVTGAAIGDAVAVGFSNAVPAGALLVGAVTTASVVSVTLFNHTGSTLDLASGTLRVDVWK